MHNITMFYMWYEMQSLQSTSFTALFAHHSNRIGTSIIVYMTSMWAFDQTLPWNHRWIMRQWAPGHRHVKVPPLLLHKHDTQLENTLCGRFSSIFDHLVLLWLFSVPMWLLWLFAAVQHLFLWLFYVFVCSDFLSLYVSVIILSFCVSLWLFLVFVAQFLVFFYVFICSDLV